MLRMGSIQPGCNFRLGGLLPCRAVGRARDPDGGCQCADGLYGRIEPTGSARSPVSQKEVVHQRLWHYMPAWRYPGDHVDGRGQVPRRIPRPASSRSRNLTRNAGRSSTWTLVAVKLPWIQ